MNRRTRMIILAVMCAWVSMAQAQYDEPRDYPQPEARYLAGGIQWRDFAPRPGNTAHDSLAVRFSAIAPTLVFRQGPVDIQFAYASYKLREATRASVSLSAMFSNDFMLVGKPTNALLLPVCLSADYTKAETLGAERDNFYMASLGIGAGLKYRYRGQMLDLSVSFVGIIHYSFEGISTGTGSSSALAGDISVLLPMVPIGEGIMLGYKFRHQTWSLNDARFDYRMTSHGPLVGIMF